MARKLRIQYEGAVYHVMSRGDRRESIFLDDADRRDFIEALGQACERCGWRIHAYVLMVNHFHLALETPRANLVDGMKWLLGTYTTRFNRRHGLTGHLFGGRYKAIPVEAGNDEYFSTLCTYIHLNPARAQALPPSKPLHDYPWSSWPAYLAARAKRPAWLETKRFAGAIANAPDSLAGRRQLAAWMEARRTKEQTTAYQPLRRGWYWGDEAFRKSLLDRISEQRGPTHGGIELRESETARAGEIIREEVLRREWKADDLPMRPKGDPEKVEIARRLRRETNVPVRWIAEQLHMGTPSYASYLLWQANSK
ncbi:MAG TPA: transposase [Kiritimatiellia bacterium]|nr:transposase [Kiritimatiellia bacterium]